MKILARGTEDKYIVELTSSEIYKLMGFCNRFELAAPRDIVIGSFLNIGSIWERLEMLRRNAESLKATAESLRHYADMVEPIGEVIRKATTLPEPPEQEAE